MRRAFLLTGLLAAACATTAPRTRGGIDLTQTLAPGIPYFPGGVPFDVAPVATHEADGYAARYFTTGEHTGTHVDAPAHFDPRGATVEEIPVDRLEAPLVVVDVRPQVRYAWDYAVSPEDVEAHERAHGRIRPGSFVAFLTGWSAFWGDPERYRNAGQTGAMRFPGISGPTARLLADRGVVGVGIDTLSLDPGPSADFAAHKVLSARGIYIVENLARLADVPPVGARIVVAPLPIGDGSGAPARVWATAR